MKKIKDIGHYLLVWHKARINGAYECCGYLSTCQDTFSYNKWVQGQKSPAVPSKNEFKDRLMHCISEVETKWLPYQK